MFLLDLQVGAQGGGQRHNGAVATPGRWPAGEKARIIAGSESRRKSGERERVRMENSRAASPKD
jgi:hypothetical protein